MTNKKMELTTKAEPIFSKFKILGGFCVSSFWLLCVCYIGGIMEPYRQYFADTEHAMMSLFENLNFYLNILREVEMPIFTSETSDIDLFTKEYELWVAQNQKKLTGALEKEKEYFGHSVSMSTICGSILQIAFMAILQFSTNKKVPEQLQETINVESNATKFCIGEDIRGVPKGLIIYAGRNQYNHMDEVTFNKYTTYVFDRLAVFDPQKNVIDPAFQLSQPKIANYASNIVAILGWRDYESYIIDMFDTLKTNMSNITYRDRDAPHKAPLPHHAAYGSVLRDSADQAESDPGEHKPK